MSSTDRPWLVADLGGTNARFALAEPTSGRLRDQATLGTGSAATLVELVGRYLEGATGKSPTSACFACAGPIIGDRISLTNAGIQFSIEQSRRELGLDQLLVVNDFAAQARAIPELGGRELFQVGEVEPRLAQGPAIVIGPGTGLGMATILDADGRWRVIPGEGGHVALSGLYDDELHVVRALRRRYGYASAEMAISGPGLCRLFLLLSGTPDASLDKHGIRPDLIVERALAEEDKTCVAALDIFCGLLGATAANAALTAGAVGGVFLAGGILRRFPDFVARSSFRERFTTHPQAGRYLSKIGTAIVLRPEPGLLGAMHLLNDEGGPRGVPCL